MNDGGSDQTPVVEVAALLPRSRWLTVWLVCGLLVITIAGSLAWAASGDSPQRDSLAPAADDTAPTETTTNETVVVVTADTVVDTIPVDTLDSAAVAPDVTCAPQKPGDRFCNAEKCIGTKAREPHAFVFPNASGMTAGDVMNLHMVFYWDLMCAGLSTTYGVQTVQQSCSADPGMAGKTYAQSPSAGTRFTPDSMAVLQLSVYMYCPPAPPSIDPPATDPPPTSPAETSPPPSP
ncbi:MAG: hypothetical protein Q7V57_05120 [Actinomycetota bacterium]|nr:hypothetical protein [Actinomycetota bacterium]